MNLTRWSPNRVRPDDTPELVASRNFDGLFPVLREYADAIEGNSGIISGILSKLRRMAYPIFQGFYITTGTNSRLEDVTLVAGAVIKANTSVTANTRFIYARQAAGGALGHLSVVGNPGVGYTVTSSSVTDTSTVAVMLVERI